MCEVQHDPYTTVGYRRIACRCDRGGERNETWRTQGDGVPVDFLKLVISRKQGSAMHEVPDGMNNFHMAQLNRLPESVGIHSSAHFEESDHDGIGLLFWDNHPRKLVLTG